METISNSTILLRSLGILFSFLSISSLIWLFREKLFVAYVKKEKEIVESLKPKLNFLVIKEDPFKLVRIFLLALLLLFLYVFFTGKTFLGGLFYASFFTVIAGVGVNLAIWWNMKKRRAKIEEQLEDALISMANTLKTVPTLTEAFQTASENMLPPISEEFENIIKQNQLGNTIEEALENASKRIQSNDFDLVVTSLTIALRTGGNLPDMLEKIAHTLREIKRVEGLIESKTAEGKMQAWVMGLFPFLMMFMMYKVDPHYVTPVFDTTSGNIILFVIILLEAIAIYLIIKITNIDI